MTLEEVRELRSRTGCGLVDCRNALRQAGSVEQAIMLLRQQGKAQAAKKAARPTGEGTIAVYVHSNAKIAAAVTLRCETDFVARTDAFQQLAHNIALHIAAADPQAIRPEDIPAAELEAERAIAQEQAARTKKPAAVQEKMVAGKLQKYQTEQALLTQAYVKDQRKTVGDLINEAVAELGENITVGEFKRLVV